MRGFLGFWPHFILVVCGWYMTVSPGCLFFHDLHTVEVFSENFDSKDIKFELSLSAAQVVSLPYVRHLFYTVTVPCFALFFYFFTRFVSPTQPDLLLFLISVIPTILACAQITFSRRLFALASAAFAALSLPISHLLLLCGAVPAVSGPSALFFRGVVLLQFACFAHTAVSRALTYFRYTHPRAGLLDLDAFHPILRRVYATPVLVLMTAWHYADVAVVGVVVTARYFAGEAAASAALIGGALASVGLTVPATKYVLQLRIIDLLLPCLRKEKADIQKYIRPIGTIAFGMAAGAAEQALLVVGMLFCATFRSQMSEFYGCVLRALLFTAALLNASARVASWMLMAHPIESQRCGYRL
jgi:hypothetical protein